MSTSIAPAGSALDRYDPAPRPVSAPVSPVFEDISVTGETYHVIGFDPSLTSFGVAILEGYVGEFPRRIEVETLRPKKKGVKRLRWFEDRIQDILFTEIERGSVDLVVLEGYSYGSPNRAHQIGELGGVVRLILDAVADAWTVVPPSRLKKFVTGKGNAPKNILRLDAVVRFGLNVIAHGSDDEIDAASLATMGAYMVGHGDGWANLTKAQEKALVDQQKSFQDGGEG